MTGKLCLIGYRSLRHEKFFSILEEASVAVLLDVRRNPYSPNPDYQKANLSLAAKETQVKYFHAPQLGVPGAGRSPINEGEPTNFQEQMATEEAELALQKIEKLIEQNRSVALMCSEPNYLDCHRRILVEILQKRNPALAVESLTAVGEQRLF